MRRVAVICLILILLMPVFTSAGKNIAAVEQKPKFAGRDFNFVLSYGITGKNVLDTFTGTYKKDLVTAGVAKTELELTNRELDMVLTELNDIDIFNFPGSFKEYINVTPCSKFSLVVTYKGKTKKISWTANNIPVELNDLGKNGSSKEMEEADVEAMKMKGLGNLVQKILDFVYQKKEYRALPQATGGYV